MDLGLKAVFLATALLIIAGIIWDSRRHRSHNRRMHREPELILEDTDHGRLEDVVMVKKKAVPSYGPSSHGANNPRTEELPSDVISISVMASNPEGFHGENIYAAAQVSNLTYGDRDIFHRFDNVDGSGSKLFSMASAVNPGTFDLAALHSFTTPGVTLFLMQTMPGKSMVAFEMMMRTAKQLAQYLGGELWDDQRNVLTVAAIDRYRERIKAYSQKKMMNL